MRKSYVYQCGLGRDAPATGCPHTRTLSWLGHACSGKQMISKVNLAIVWEWVLWSSDVLKQEPIIVWDGCSGRCMLSKISIYCFRREPGLLVAAGRSNYPMATILLR